MRKTISIIFVILVCNLTGTIINVPIDQSTIQSGINAAVDTDTVLVQPGTYYENINYYNKNITVASLFLTSQDTTYISQTIIDGSQPSNPDSASVVMISNSDYSEMVLVGFKILGGSGIINEFDRTEGGGIYIANSCPLLKNLIVVNNIANEGGGIFCSNASPIMNDIQVSDNLITEHYGTGGGIYLSECSNISINNVTVSNNTHFEGYFTRGGGISLSQCNNITLENLTVINNSANYGGGIYLHDSSDIELEDINIADNYAIFQTGYCGEGGGIYVTYYSDVNFTNVVLDNNSAHKGGGIFIYISCVTANNILVHTNTAGEGGGIFCKDNATFILTNSSIFDNEAIGTHSYGGGIYCLDECNITLINSKIFSNSAVSRGGGLYLEDVYNLHSYNVLFTNNSAKAGAAIGVENSSPIFINTTISNNIANSTTPLGGGIYCFRNSNVNYLNCISYDNYPQEVFMASWSDPCSITISFSDIQGGQNGIITNNNGTVNWLDGNMDQQPLFIGIGDYPYSLTEISPCINTGIQDTTGLNLPDNDLAGNPRIFGYRIDMGSYEWQGTGSANDELPFANIHLNNYPNPFNPSTTIDFSIQNDSQIELSIFNIKGQKIKTLVNHEFTKGSHSIVWNGDDELGKSTSSGIYYYKLNVNGKTVVVNKCLLLK